MKPKTHLPFLLPKCPSSRAQVAIKHYQPRFHPEISSPSRCSFCCSCRKNCSSSCVSSSPRCNFCRRSRARCRWVESTVGSDTPKEERKETWKLGGSSSRLVGWSYAHLTNMILIVLHDLLANIKHTCTCRFLGFQWPMRHGRDTHRKSTKKHAKKKVLESLLQATSTNIRYIYHPLSHYVSHPKTTKKLTGDTMTKALLPKIIPNLELTSGKPPSTRWRVAARLPEMLQRKIQLPNCRKSRLLRLEWTEDVSFLWEKVCFCWGCMQWRSDQYEGFWNGKKEKLAPT